MCVLPHYFPLHLPSVISRVEIETLSCSRKGPVFILQLCKAPQTVMYFFPSSYSFLSTTHRLISSWPRNLWIVCPCLQTINPWIVLPASLNRNQAKSISPLRFFPSARSPNHWEKAASGTALYHQEKYVSGSSIAHHIEKSSREPLLFDSPGRVKAPNCNSGWAG